MPDARHVCDFVDVCFRMTVGVQAERDILFDGQVWKKSIILVYVTDAAFARFEAGNITPFDEDYSGLDFFRPQRHARKIVVLKTSVRLQNEPTRTKVTN
jgi:hypothetical protein